MRPGESAFFVTEQLGFLKTLREAGAIDFYERLTGESASVVNDPRYQVFSGASLPKNQDRWIVRGTWKIHSCQFV